MQGHIPTSVTYKAYQLDTTRHILLSKQFETIQNEARQEARAKISEHQKQTAPLMKITPKQITPEIYQLLTGFGNNTGCGQCLTNNHTQSPYRMPGSDQ